MNSKLLLLAAASLPVLALTARAGALTPGNVVVLRLGDGSAALTNAATAGQFDEYTPAGVLVQTIAIPSTGTDMLNFNGTATADGLLSLSEDGTRICFGGYRKAAGGTNPVADAPATTNRVIGLLAADGSMNTTTALTDSTGNCRSVTVTNTGASYIATNSGIRYAAPATSTTTVIDTRNSRQVLIGGGVLYASNGTTILPKLQNYGGLPTATTVATPVVSLLAADAVQGFWLGDLSTTVAGIDTIYLASGVENLLRKYTFDGTTWAATGSVTATGILNISGTVSGGTVTIFYTTTTAGTGVLGKIDDATGYNGTLAGTAATLVTVGTNKAFRGVAVVPGASAPVYQFSSISFGAPVQINWTGTPAIAPAILYSDDLTGWLPLGTATEITPGQYRIDDPTAADRRFYRIAP